MAPGMLEGATSTGHPAASGPIWSPQSMRVLGMYGRPVEPSLSEIGRPYECVTCGKGFKRAYHLKMHVRTHTGEKPHKCSVCGADFSDHSNFRKHVKKHGSQT